jgi:hypothetical protein
VVTLLGLFLERSFDLPASDVQTGAMTVMAVTTVTTVTTVRTSRRVAQGTHAGTAYALPRQSSRRANFDSHGRALAQYSLPRQPQTLKVYSSALGDGFEGGERPETANQSSDTAIEAERSTGQTQTQTFGSILGIVDQRKHLSMQQRYRALVLTLQAFVRSNALLQQLASSVDGIFTPLRAKKAAFDDRLATVLEDYDQYLAMETKARWSWEKRHRKEMAMLASIPPFIGMTLATVLYEVFVPCSLGFAVLLPLYMSWVLYDRWYLSPMVLGMVLIARLKFAPVGVANGVWCLVWPGLV